MAATSGSDDRAGTKPGSASRGERLRVRPSLDRAFWGGLDTATLAGVVDRAHADLGAPWPRPLASDFARFVRDGNRTAYEEQVWPLTERLTRATVTAAVEREDTWLDEVTNGVVLWCELSTWSWPAHDDAYERRGWLLPDVERPYLDLGAGEVAAQLAWIDHVLGDDLERRTAGLRSRLRREVDQRVIEPFLTRMDWHWLGLDGHSHNWNPWIHGNIAVAALICTEGQRRERTLQRVREGLDRYVASVPPDGGIDEGYLYWWNGLCRLLEALALLADASGSSARVAPAVREAITFPARMQLGPEWYVSYADSSARPDADQPWHVPFRWGRQLGLPEVVAHAAAHRRPGAPVGTEKDGLGRLLHALADRDWVATTPTSPPLPERVWLPDTQVWLAREQEGEAAGLAAVVKGGHNAENHNHNDVGSAIVALDGVPHVVDPGRGVYSRVTFSADRYTQWLMTSSWHSVPEPDGVAQPPGREFAARTFERADDGDRSVVAVELADAYPLPGLRSWRREVALERAAGRVVVRDTWEAERAIAPRVHLVLAWEVALLDGDRAQVRRPGAESALLLTWDTATAELTSRDLDDAMLREVWGERLTRLTLTAPRSAAGELVLVATRTVPTP